MRALSKINIAWIGGAAVVLFASGVLTGWSLTPASRAGHILGTKTSSEAPKPEQVIIPLTIAEPGQSSDFPTRVHVALSIRDREKRLRALSAVADGLDATQIRDALDRFGKSHLPNQKEIVAQLYARWGEIDPQTALAYAETLNTKGVREEAMKAIIGGWVEHDVAAAEKWVSNLPKGPLKNSVLGTLIIAVAATDLPHALQLARSPGIDWQPGDGVTHALFDRWMESNPREAAAAAAQLPDGLLLGMTLPWVAKQWAETDPQAALGWVLSLPKEVSKTEDRGMTGWSGTAINGLMQTWINQDSAAALAWLKSLPADGHRVALLDAACVFIADGSHDPQVAAQCITLLPEGARQDYAYAGCAARIAMYDPAGALAWALAQPDEHVERMMLPATVPRLAGDDLLSALQEVQRLNATGKEQISLDSLFSVISVADHQTLATWAVQQTNNQQYLARIVTSWTMEAPDDLNAWINSLSPPVRDETLRGIIEGTSSPKVFEAVAPFKRAAQYLPQIADPQIRESAAESLAANWLRLNRASAQAWLATAPLPDDVKSQLLNAAAAQK